MPRRSLTDDELLDRFRSIHGNRYIYCVPFNVRTQHDKIQYWCRKHNCLCETTVNSHLQGCGCKLCGFDKIRESKLKKREEFIQQCYEKFGRNLYDYSEFEYKGAYTEGKIRCLVCGEVFEMSPVNHLCKGHGCKRCRLSRLERIVWNLLKENGVPFQYNRSLFCQSFGCRHSRFFPSVPA